MSGNKIPGNADLRLRVFAGPNGSGKSTVIKYIRELKVNGHSIDFGTYINADDIAVCLKQDKFTFDTYDILVNPEEFIEIVLDSGLIDEEFNEQTFNPSYHFNTNAIRLKSKIAGERLAQIIADFLRKKLLQENRKFSFETVFFT